MYMYAYITRRPSERACLCPLLRFDTNYLGNYTGDINYWELYESGEGGGQNRLVTMTSRE